MRIAFAIPAALLALALAGCEEPAPPAPPRSMILGLDGCDWRNALPLATLSPLWTTSQGRHTPSKQIDPAAQLHCPPQPSPAPHRSHRPRRRAGIGRLTGQRPRMEPDGQH